VFDILPAKHAHEITFVVGYREHVESMGIEDLLCLCHGVVRRQLNHFLGNQVLGGKQVVVSCHKIPQDVLPKDDPNKLHFSDDG